MSKVYKVMYEEVFGMWEEASVAASAPVAERSGKLKGLMTHRFHKAQVY